MNLSEKMLKQCRKPTGFSGRVIAKLMNRGHHKLTDWGLTHVSIQPNDVILDVGCGGGRTVNKLAEMAVNGKVYGVDYSEDSVKVATKQNQTLIEAGRVKILHGSVETLPFADSFFDLVTAIETYYFWPDLNENLKEIKRVLKPKGQLILINEAYKHENFEERNSKWGKLGNFEYHAPEEFRRFLDNSGYISINIDVLEDKNWIMIAGVKPLFEA
jgi:ubiquinone/menaquinone biosynthesis C-methylase UbiE